MMKFFILLILSSSIAHAYTFNNNFGASFKSKNVNVTIESQTTCLNAGMTIYELEDLITPALDDFWNRVPTSSLRLRNGGFSGPVTNINTGRLCAPTDNKCITDAGANVIAPVTDIVIACNNDGLNFGTGVLAVTIPNHFSGRSIVGSVILINETVGSNFANLSRSDKIGVLAHEIGHAIGLGHTKDEAALMFYRVVDLRRALGGDDIRGVSYLYPIKLDGFGLLGGCGTIKSHDGTPPQSPPFWQMGATLGLIVLLAELIKLLKRSKTRTSA